MSANTRKIFYTVSSIAFIFLLANFLFVQLANRPLQSLGQVSKNDLFSPIPTPSQTPFTLPTPLTPENTPYSIPPATLVPNPEPTATSEPYVGLVVSKVEPVANGPYLHMLWSPDGTKALITKQVSHLHVLAQNPAVESRIDVGINDLWLLDLTNNSEKQLFTQVGRYAWSPDAKQLVLLNPIESEGIAGMLLIYDLDTGKIKSLVAADFLGSDYAPHWLPTDEIVYVRDGLLWSIQPDGSNEQRFANFAFFSRFISWANKKMDDPQQIDVGGFHFSPNGKRIAYKTLHNNIQTIAYKLWLADVDGNNAKMITGQAEGGYYDWSPDGTWLVFNTYRDVDDPNLDSHLPNTQAIWVVSEDGLARYPIYRNDTWQTLLSPAWSPDNTKLAFIVIEPAPNNTEIRSLWIGDVTETNRTAPLDGSINSNSRIRWVWWVPDGKSLITLKDSLISSGFLSERLSLN